MFSHSSGVICEIPYLPPDLPTLGSCSGIIQLPDWLKALFHLRVCRFFSVSEFQQAILYHSLPTYPSVIHSLWSHNQILAIASGAYYSGLSSFELWYLDIRQHNRIPVNPIRRQSFIPVASQENVSRRRGSQTPSLSRSLRISYLGCWTVRSHGDDESSPQGYDQGSSAKSPVTGYDYFYPNL